jgi:hypothetical protein
MPRYQLRLLLYCDQIGVVVMITQRAMTTSAGLDMMRCIVDDHSIIEALLSHAELSQVRSIGMFVHIMHVQVL